MKWRTLERAVSSDGRVSGEGLWSSSLCLHRFIIELCQPIQVKQLDIANFEIFSSNPKDFVVSISDRSALMGSVTDWLCIYGFSITKSYHFFNLFVIFTCSTSVCMCYNVSWLVYTQISEQKVGEAWEVSCAWRADGAEFSSGWASVCQIHQGETETVTVCEVSGVWFTSRSCLFPPVASDVHQIH